MRWLGALVLAVLSCNSVEEGPVRRADATRRGAWDGRTVEPEVFYLDDSESPATATLCSGDSGLGGYCELTFLRARTFGLSRLRLR